MEIINVVTIKNNVVDEIKSFVVPYFGHNINKHAEYYFIRKAKELGFDELNEDSNFILDDGYYEKDNRSVCITHSFSE